MKQSVNSYDFIEAFRTMGRYDQFGYEALEILFNYLEEYEESCGTEIELDVIALCCDYSVDTWQGIAEQYSIDLSECEDDDARIEAVTEYLRENTQVCGTYGDETNDVTHIVYCFAF